MMTAPHAHVMQSKSCWHYPIEERAGNGTEGKQVLRGKLRVIDQRFIQMAAPQASRKNTVGKVPLEKRIESTAKRHHL